MGATSGTDPQVLAPVKYSSVLLIDGDPRRQFERAASMRRAGLHVDCAEDATTAIALWVPDKYRLVLIDLHQAGNDVHAFCSKLQKLSPPQKVGIYRSKSPFIVQPGDPLLKSDDAPRLPRSGLEQAAGEFAVKGRNGLAHAAQRIRALRPKSARHAVATPAAPAPARPERESNADIAARVLGGTS